MATGSLESNDSGVSLKSDQSKAARIDFKDRVSVMLDFSSSEEDDVSDDEDLVESPDDQQEDDILPYMYPWADDCDWMELADNLPDCSSSEKKHVVADDGFFESPDDQMATGSLESNDSGVSLKSDQSKAARIDFKDRVSVMLDFSSSEEDDVSDDEDLVESPDDLGGDEPGAVV